MRPVLINDLTSAARALLFVQPAGRERLAAQLLQNADAGDRYTRRFGRIHADFGDGTLSAAARKRPLARDPTLDDFAYCECLALVLQLLLTLRVERRRMNIKNNQYLGHSLLKYIPSQLCVWQFRSYMPILSGKLRGL